MRAALIACLLAVSMRTARAQTATDGTLLTLEEALNLAETHSESIAAAEADVSRARAEQMRARSGWFPQLSASVSYDRALASEFSNLFTGVPDDLQALPFGRANTWRADLSFSQTIFSGGRLSALSRIAAAGRENAVLEVTTTRAQVLFDVTQAYYDAALGERLVAIADATVQQAQSTFEMVQAGYRAGTQPEFELLRARVTRDNQMPALIRQRANRDLALLRLAQLLDLPPTIDLRLADSLESPALPPPSPFAPRLAVVESSFHSTDRRGAMPPNGTVAERTAVKEASTDVALREAEVRAARAERLPDLSLRSNYGRVAYPSRPLPSLDEFRTNWAIGATMQVAILTGGRLRAGEQIAEANLAQSRARLQQTRELAELDARSALAQLIASRAAWEASGGTVQQAQRAYEIADVRYRAGVSTQLELTDSRLLFQQAALNRAQAARDLQVARARVALLPDLPLGTGQSGTSIAPQLPPQVPIVPATPAPPPPGSAQPRTRAASASTPAQTRGPR